MKIALISDLHFGVKKSNEIFFASQKRFFVEQMIPHLKSNGIKDLFILGDLLDNRNHVNVSTMNEVYNLFKNDLADFDIRIFPGNHDIYYKTSIDTNSILFLSSLPNVTLIGDIELDKKVLEATGKKILMVPWQVDEAAFAQRVASKNLGCDYCFGHFELSGFAMNQYSVCEGGLNPEVMLDNFDRTFTGHFHKRSMRERNGKFIQYIGSPFHITRNDIGDERGFTVIDLDNDTQEFVQNTKSIKYIEISFPEVFTKEQIKGNIVDVRVKYNEDYDETLVHHYMRIVEKYGPIYPPTVKIENLMFANAEQEFQGVQTIDELIKEYVGSLQLPNKNTILENIMNLYRQCSRG